VSYTPHPLDLRPVHLPHTHRCASTLDVGERRSDCWPLPAPSLTVSPRSRPSTRGFLVAGGWKGRTQVVNTAVLMGQPASSAPTFAIVLASATGVAVHIFRACARPALTQSLLVLAVVEPARTAARAGATAAAAANEPAGTTARKPCATHTHTGRNSQPVSENVELLCGSRRHRDAGHLPERLCWFEREAAV
jgi:hypothetical protein